MENLETVVDNLFAESDRRIFEIMQRILDTVIDFE
jgi:hypothetical protein